MNEEEKKAMEIVKGLAVYYDDYGLLDEEEIEENEEVNNSINIVLNLIEKQSKKIEELQAINQMQKYRIEVMDERELISRDEVESIITTEIEKLNKKEKENLKGTKGQDRYAIKQEYMYKKSSLQSILDKIKGDDK